MVFPESRIAIINQVVGFKITVKGFVD